jgi:hAT family C-terminal dimerisation region
MEGHCGNLRQREYSHLASKEDDAKPKDAFEVWRNGTCTQDQPGDEFSLGQQFPSIRQWAFDALACPATSCECERAFSGAKRLLSPNLNALGDDIIEAWWDNRLVQLH